MRRACELTGKVPRRPWNIVADDERWFVQGQFRDVEPTSCSLECEDRTRRIAEHERRSARFANERIEILDFALHCVRLSISTRTAAPPIVVQHLQLQLQGFSQRRTRRSLVEGPYHENDRWTLTRLIKSDLCSVSRNCCSHRRPPKIQWRFLLRRKWEENCSLRVRVTAGARTPRTHRRLQTW